MHTDGTRTIARVRSIYAFCYGIMYCWKLIEKAINTNPTMGWVVTNKQIVKRCGQQRVMIRCKAKRLAAKWNDKNGCVTPQRFTTNDLFVREQYQSTKPNVLRVDFTTKNPLFWTIYYINFR